MNVAAALAILRKLGVPALDTADAAAALGLTTAAASQTLTRLARAGLVRSVRHGTWWLEDALDPLRLPEYLTAPLPAYVSLQTALHRHGLIEQIPEVVYAVSLAKTQRLMTKVGAFSIHHGAGGLRRLRGDGARREGRYRREGALRLRLPVERALTPLHQPARAGAATGLQA